MMNKPKVSIVVPVYNGEKYLRECLDSLVNQTLKELEIICVNDGSTDSSTQILKEYASKDSRIKVLNQKNHGVSAARNFGIENFSGEYLTFVDADDWIELNALEILYKTIEERKTEMLIFSFKNYFSPTDVVKDNRLLFADKIKGNDITFLNSYENIFNSPMGTWGKIYKAELIKKNKILFPLNIQCGEDRPFYIKACICAKNIAVLDEPLYYYRRNISGSLTQGNSTTLSDLYIANQMIKKMIYKFKNKKQIHCAFLSSYIDCIVWGYKISKSHKIKDIGYLKLVKKECREFRKYINFPAESYKKLTDKITEFEKLFIKKIFEPFIEIEKRKNRFSLYLFEKQVINIAK